MRALADSGDEVFSTEALGKGCLIIPDDNRIYAPFNGKVTTLFPTKHAIGITAKDGVELLIHVGINTVNLKGQGFEAYVNQGDSVKKGQLLLEFDKEAIEKAGFSCEIPLVITNSSKYLDVVELDHAHHQKGDDIMAIIYEVKS